MATKNLVPRANGEGKLGTAEKTWAEVNAKEINLDGKKVSESLIELENKITLAKENVAKDAKANVDTVNEALNGAQNEIKALKELLEHNYRKPATAYEVGDIVYHPSLPAGYYLECITAGVTADGDLTI